MRRQWMLFVGADPRVRPYCMDMVFHLSYSIPIWGIAPIRGIRMKQQTRPKRNRMRLSGWDYSRPGAYFVTLCTQRRESFFVNTEIQAVIEGYWLRLREKYMQVELDAFVIMPDHLHGIILIHEDGPAPPNVPLGRMMQWFKSMTTNAYIRGVREDRWPPFSGRLWQRGYYDRVIRNLEEMDRIRGYVHDNPDKLPGMG